VCGLHGGGTSMTAGLLFILGVQMIFDREKSNEKTVEDHDFFHSVRSDFLEEKIKERNEKYPIWGAKMPSFWREKNRIKQSSIENPIFIYVTRDPYTIFQKERGEFRQLDEYTKMASTIKHNDLVISYEKALLFPERAIDTLIYACQLSPTEEQLKKAFEFVKPELGHESIYNYL
jgi:hypothetical protein